MADVITLRLYRKINRDLTYHNVITSRGSETAKIPMVMRSDKEAISAALLTCSADGEEARVSVIEDTLHLKTIWVSSAVAVDLGLRPTLENPLKELEFDINGNLVWPFEMEKS